MPTDLGSFVSIGVSPICFDGFYFYRIVRISGAFRISNEVEHLYRWVSKYVVVDTIEDLDNCW